MIFDAVASLWNGGINAKTTQQTNAINKRIAEENLAYQKERASIEDARYADETAYNRAWAEEQRDYERQLQQTLFEREDTALERQAESLSKMGINPASQQLNGLGAGSPVSATTAPSASTQDSEPLYNEYKPKQVPIMDVLSTIASLQQGLESIKTGREQRDSIRLQNDKQKIENMKQLFDLGFDVEDFDKLGLDIPYISEAKGLYWKDKYFNSDNKVAANKKLWTEANDADYEYNGKKNRKIYNFDSDLIKNARFFGSDDFTDLFENIITRGSAMADNLFQKFTENKQSKEEESKLKKFFNFLFSYGF